MPVDGGSSLNLLTAKVLATLQIPFSRLQDTGVFQGVNGNITRPLGKIALPITFGDPDTPLPYNSILGRPALAKFMVVSHFAYNMMKIPTAWGVIRVKADIDDAIYCVQRLNQTVAATADTRQDMQDAGADATLGAEGTPGARHPRLPRGSPSAATRR